LNQIASILGVDMRFFLPDVQGSATALLPADKDSFDLLSVFEKIESKAMKRAIINVARAASEEAAT
jgi:hypothetical protein